MSHLLQDCRHADAGVRQGALLQSLLFLQERCHVLVWDLNESIDLFWGIAASDEVLSSIRFSQTKSHLFLFYRLKSTAVWQL